MARLNAKTEGFHNLVHEALDSAIAEAETKLLYYKKLKEKYQKKTAKLNSTWSLDSMPRHIFPSIESHQKLYGAYVFAGWDANNDYKEVYVGEGNLPNRFSEHKSEFNKWIKGTGSNKRRRSAAGSKMAEVEDDHQLWDYSYFVTGDKRLGEILETMMWYHYNGPEFTPESSLKPCWPPESWQATRERINSTYGGS
jgi:hypothetical protein